MRVNDYEQYDVIFYIHIQLYNDCRKLYLHTRLQEIAEIMFVS